nr:basic proline-rich protein-like [Aegilops tauschii subsp. strangulata]
MVGDSTSTSPRSVREERRVLAVGLAFFVTTVATLAVRPRVRRARGLASAGRFASAPLRAAPSFRPERAFAPPHTSTPAASSNCFARLHPERQQRLNSCSSTSAAARPPAPPRAAPLLPCSSRRRRTPPRCSNPAQAPCSSAATPASGLSSPPGAPSRPASALGRGDLHVLPPPCTRAGLASRGRVLVRLADVVPVTGPALAVRLAVLAPLRPPPAVVPRRLRVPGHLLRAPGLRPAWPTPTCDSDPACADFASPSSARPPRPCARRLARPSSFARAGLPPSAQPGPAGSAPPGFGSARHRARSAGSSTQPRLAWPPGGAEIKRKKKVNGPAGRKKRAGC